MYPQFSLSNSKQTAEQTAVYRSARKEDEVSMSTLRRMFIAAAFLPLLSCSQALAQYVRSDLVSNSGAGGTVQDPNLENPWGLVGWARGPFCGKDNATRNCRLYPGARQHMTLEATIARLK